MRPHTALLVDLDKEIDRSGQRRSGSKTQRGSLGVGGLVASGTPLQRSHTRDESGAADTCHDAAGKAYDVTKDVRSLQVEVPREVDQVPKVDCFDGDRARRLPGEVALPWRISAVADDQDAALRARCRSASREKPPLVIVTSVKVNPTHMLGSTTQVDGLTPAQAAAYIEEPVAEVLGTSVSPAPRRRKFSGNRKPCADFTNPVRHPATERKDGLHVIAEDYRGQCPSRRPHNGVLSHVAVLVFINNESGEARREDVADMARFHKLSSGHSYRWILGSRVLKVQYWRVMSCTRWEC